MLGNNINNNFFALCLKANYFSPLVMSPFIGIILLKAWIFMSSRISYKENKNRIKKKLSFFEGGHQLEKLEFALAIAQTKGDEKKSIVLRKKIVELGGNVEEPGT